MSGQGPAASAQRPAGSGQRPVAGGRRPAAGGRLFPVLLGWVFLGACGETTLLDPMERQPKFRAFAANAQFEDGRAMRRPPAGTVPRERQTQRPEITLGKDKYGQEVAAFPVAVTRELMDRGRKKFEIHCAVCHGLLGDGVSPVATQMSLRPPPDLHKLHNVGPGHLFQVISAGYGLMASYAAELTAQDRWAVIAYVHALRRSQAATLAEAPPDIQRKLREETAQ
jgi:mono/diheme cytochrome c family protein